MVNAVVPSEPLSSLIFPVFGVFTGKKAFSGVLRLCLEGLNRAGIRWFARVIPCVQNREFAKTEQGTAWRRTGNRRAGISDLLAQLESKIADASEAVGFRSCSPESVP